MKNRSVWFAFILILVAIAGLCSVRRSAEAQTASEPFYLHISPPSVGLRPYDQVVCWVQRVGETVDLSCVVKHRAVTLTPTPIKPPTATRTATATRRPQVVPSATVPNTQPPTATNMMQSTVTNTPRPTATNTPRPSTPTVDPYPGPTEEPYPGP